MIILERNTGFAYHSTVLADFFRMTAVITVHEGEQESISEPLEQSESISWELDVADGYDIQFSVIIRSSTPTQKSSWIYLEPTRLSKSVGTVTPAELQQDGIELPVTIEFVLDNEFSWFSPKEVRIGVRRFSSTPSPPVQPDAVSVPQSPSRDELERRRSLQGRERLDLMWLKHVVSEAIDRCPESYDEVRDKLVEIRSMLRYVED